MLKSKKGFTLVELIVVVAIIAIVITMVCGFMLTYQHQTFKITKNSVAMADIDRLKDAVNQWLDENESGSTVFTVSDSKIETGGKSLSFSSGKLKVDGGSQIEFETLSGCRFYKKNSIDNIIYCDVTVKIGDSERKVQLLFDVNYGGARERS